MARATRRGREGSGRDRAHVRPEDSTHVVLVGLLLTAVFVALNGFFVTAEFALVKLRATQISRLAKRHDAAARAAVDVCKRLDRYLSATQLGITSGGKPLR